MILIVGLGNPGVEYVKTRHNIGFMVLERIITNCKLNTHKKKFNSIYYVLDQGIILLLPQTYMNNSGIAIQNFCRFFKIKTENVVVVHDDIDLELGKIKIKRGGGHGGHNGLKSIDQNLGCNYLRIRLGIGRAKYDGITVADYVLQQFIQSEIIIVNQMLAFVSNHILSFVQGSMSQEDVSTFLTKYKLTI